MIFALTQPQPMTWLSHVNKSMHLSDCRLPALFALHLLTLGCPLSFVGTVTVAEISQEESKQHPLHLCLLQSLRAMSSLYGSPFTDLINYAICPMS